MVHLPPSPRVGSYYTPLTLAPPTLPFPTAKASTAGLPASAFLWKTVPYCASSHLVVCVVSDFLGSFPPPALPASSPCNPECRQRPLVPTGYPFVSLPRF
ncbi:unnamed protein product [Prunus armeniaca]|uniref:Uncharacterized protein n=1 Tax=Prunus armeniaca TaxID=36596 RepID=A0A6J5UBC0_PRUAR|nr:unnamed protein product [Prunus armeniaca]